MVISSLLIFLQSIIFVSFYYFNWNVANYIANNFKRVYNLFELGYGYLQVFNSWNIILFAIGTTISFFVRGMKIYRIIGTIAVFLNVYELIISYNYS